MTTKRNFTFAILGAGGRGSYFANWINTHPDAGRVVAVAEPNPDRRKRVADANAIPSEMQFERWEDLLAKPKLADAIINTTMDQLHMPSALKALSLGYHMLLEKPMATSLEDCIAVDKARRESSSIVSICHSFRYTVVFTEIMRLLNAGVIGDLVSFDQVEAVEHIHHTHSYVRGNWGNEARSTFMLMSKSCHDIDILAHVVGKPCLRVSSYGSLKYFCKNYAPKDAPEYCTDGCPAEMTCPYSSLKVYAEPNVPWGWAKHAGFTQVSFAERLAALKHSKFDRCVFQSDNDVVDHQVVAFEFEGAVTGTFTMTAFTPFMGRFLRLHGTKGFISAQTDTNTIDVYRLADRKHDHIVAPVVGGVHGGADDRVMVNFIHALRMNDPKVVLTGTDESLKTHAIVFAAEKARLEKRVVEISELAMQLAV